MKKLIFIGVVSLFLTACGAEEEEPETTETQAEESETEEGNGTEENNESTENTEDPEETTGGGNQVGDVISNEIGESTLVSLANDVGEFETGPMILTIDKVNGVSSDLNAQGTEMFDTEQLEYIQIDITVENTSEDTVTFYADQATITTDTGEQIDGPDMLMSDHLGGEFIGEVEKTGTLIYPLEQSAAEEVSTVRILVNGPSDDNLDRVGEDIDTEVTLNK
ncbi:hypothetical protein D7Z54_13570 [Salibacterium salarium]|uniref:DUF4352 domain-containing protein n=1 Tax=Salibacterium salarium TaxID=284579 RepID=A0A428N2U1_9BACI|nr:hypothetical protein [Salibacterium salarium]RSL32770.1 hypothetical protein D7Z54_13570 [Salibacterium salarium]